MPPLLFHGGASGKTRPARHYGFSRPIAIAQIGAAIGREAAAGSLTQDSTGEQGRLGFTALTRAELDRVSDINRRYREKFGFPVIVALARHATRDTVIAEMERRIANDADTEIANALEQIGYITRARLGRKFETL